MAILLLTVVCVFVPFSPWMPSAGLDASWSMGLNQAYAQGLIFGTDIVFNFGPYASIYTRMYHPSTDFLMMAGSSYLALCYFCCLCVFLRRRPWPFALMFSVLLAAFVTSRDALLFSYPVLLGLVAIERLPMPHPMPPRTSSISADRMISASATLRRTRFILAALFLPIGLLLLIKINVLVLCLVIVTVCASFFACHRQISTALVCLLSPIIGLTVFASLAGMPLGALRSYFLVVDPLVSGYAEAMALSPGPEDLAAFIGAALFVVLAGCYGYRRRFVTLVHIAFLYSAALFFGFKLGFVRADGHVQAAISMLVFTAFIIAVRSASAFAWCALLGALLAWMYIDEPYAPMRELPERLVTAYTSGSDGLISRISESDALGRRFDAALASLRTKQDLPVLQGTSDIYSWQQAVLIASGNRWSPRPVIQSYSAYTPALIELNRRHLIGPTAPDNVFFALEPIDGRLPMLDDGASWPILIQDYEVVAMRGKILQLRRKEGIHEAATTHGLSSTVGRFGAPIAVPDDARLVFARIDVEPTWIGRIVALLYRPPLIYIVVDMADGTPKEYRFVSGIAKETFLISPLVKKTEEFAMLHEPAHGPERSRVLSFTLSAGGGASWLWQDAFQVIFEAL